MYGVKPLFVACLGKRVLGNVNCFLSLFCSEHYVNILNKNLEHWLYKDTVSSVKEWASLKDIGKHNGWYNSPFYWKFCKGLEKFKIEGKVTVWSWINFTKIRNVTYFYMSHIYIYFRNKIIWNKLYNKQHFKR